MSQSDQTIVTTQAETSKDYPSKAAAATTRGSTKDTGRVHIGGGMMHFHSATTRKSTKDTGRVHIGGGMMRF